MADSSVQVRVRGVRELSAALRRVSTDAAKEMKLGFKDIAEDVAQTVRGRVPRRTGRAASSVKARGSARGGSIAFGGSAAPHYPWLDFGGNVGPDRRIHRPFIREGRYVFPTIREKGTDIRTRTEELVEKVAKRAGFDVRG